MYSIKGHNERYRALEDVCMLCNVNASNGCGQADQHLFLPGQAPRLLHSWLNLSVHPIPPYDWMQHAW